MGIYGVARPMPRPQMEMRSPSRWANSAEAAPPVDLTAPSRGLGLVHGVALAAARARRVLPHRSPGTRANTSSEASKERADRFFFALPA